MLVGHCDFHPLQTHLSIPLSDVLTPPCQMYEAMYKEVIVEAALHGTLGRGAGMSRLPIWNRKKGLVKRRPPLYPRW